MNSNHKRPGIPYYSTGLLFPIDKQGKMDMMARHRIDHRRPTAAFRVNMTLLHRFVEEAVRLS